MSIVTKFTVKRAEISVAIILALCSAALMMKSAENRITWSAEENMGAGFLPFYLSLGMLICCNAYCLASDPIFFGRKKVIYNLSNLYWISNSIEWMPFLRGL